MSKKEYTTDDDSILDNSDLADEEEIDNNDDKSEGDAAPARLPRNTIIRYSILGVAFLVFIVSAISLIKIFADYQKGVDIYESIEAAVFNTESTSMVPEGSIAETTAPLESFSYAQVETAAELEKVDISSLYQLNNQAIGWIQIPSITRSYPVAQGTDNSYYLTHTFTREENNAGSIFMDARNYSDFSDRNTIIYGHNMKNGTMFGMLNRFEKEEFYRENNSCFYLTTQSGVRAYQIFAVCLVPSDSLVYIVDFGGEVSFTDFLSYVDNHKLYSTGVVVLPTDYVVTLSTCTSDSGTRRIVLGKYIGTIEQ